MQDGFIHTEPLSLQIEVYIVKRRAMAPFQAMVFPRLKIPNSIYELHKPKCRVCKTPKVSHFAANTTLNLQIQNLYTCSKVNQNTTVKPNQQHDNPVLPTMLRGDQRMVFNRFAVHLWHHPRTSGEALNHEAPR